jgi:hypothetical protein
MLLITALVSLHNCSYIFSFGRNFLLLLVCQNYTELIQLLAYIFPSKSLETFVGMEDLFISDLCIYCLLALGVSFGFAPLCFLFEHVFVACISSANDMLLSDASQAFWQGHYGKFSSEMRENHENCKGRLVFKHWT